MKAIINTKLVMEDGIIWDGAVTYENGKIIQVGWKNEVDIPDSAEIYDANGNYTAPGLIDIHNHGCTEYWFYEKPLEVSKYFLKHGVTTVLPTFYHSMTKEDMIEGAAKIREVRKNGAGKIMEGIYMEGPFMMLMGSFQSQIKWKDPIDKQDYIDLVESFGDLVSVWAIDPARENIDEFMVYVKERKPNAIFAHGHSHATFEDSQKVKRLGLKIRTHIINAGQVMGRTAVTPGAGGDQHCFYDPDMYAELICDESAIHVPPGLIKMVIRTKGVERVCLISDHTTCGEVKNKNNEELGVWYGSDINYDDRGKVAGSLMTLDGGVRNTMTHSGYGLCHAIRMATLTPAEALGIDDKVGSLAKGKKANFIIIDDMVNIKKVILEGELAVDNGEVLI